MAQGFESAGAPSKVVLSAEYTIGPTPKRITKVERIPSDLPDRTVEIRYSGHRVGAFFRDNLDPEITIGTCTQRIFAPSSTVIDSPIHSVQTDVVSIAEYEVFFCWSIGSGNVWHEMRMQAEDSRPILNDWKRFGEFKAIVPLESYSYLKVLFHYFRLVGRLRADRSKSKVKSDTMWYERKDACPSDYVDHQWYYPDDETLREVVLFDNPYGPRSNYHF